MTAPSAMTGRAVIAVSGIAAHCSTQLRRAGPLRNGPPIVVSDGGCAAGVLRDIIE
ncbi:hypothetical protein [Streptomyces longisporoflavus]|uniref:Uncharacterized protein n=1 Tax=Streptomyces longisporoflavus TaxID=28044 RepID=A0ABW7QKM2_9ACTN